jgi:biotin carboxyl carrier protein
MKMENEVKATKPGIIQFECNAGQIIKANTLLAKIIE